ncbi:mesoderm posterior protein 1-like [Rhopilema esculentum]|uniref:mesoderm posterior protein 1-like n=1 Tax=Rhopilema esculentum TaxID=499914 RepID=UPI0031E32560|eukprot:gene8471-14462_t
MSTVINELSDKVKGKETTDRLSKETVLGAKYGNTPCMQKRSKGNSSRKKGDIANSLQINHGSKRSTQSNRRVRKCKNKGNRRDNDADDENLSPGTKQSWRSRCGRKRKYFGYTSARQGATKRERNRFNTISSALDELRKVIPQAQHPVDGKLSKFATLKLACTYISLLTNALCSEEKMVEVGQEMGISHVPSHCRFTECEKDSQINSGLSEDELFIGDFTDVLLVDDDQETVSIYDQLTKHSLREEAEHNSD